jgi:hypothetical protein
MGELEGPIMGKIAVPTPTLGRMAPVKKAPKKSKNPTSDM